MPSTFYLGATGYIGGSVLVALLARYPDWEVTALVRTERFVQRVRALGVTVVQGSFTDEALLSPIIGIVFLLIIVRVGLGISSDADTRVAAESSMDVSATPKRSHHHAARCTDTDPSSAWTSVPVSSGVHLDTMDDIVLSSISGNSGPLRSQGSYETDMWKVDDRSEGFPGDAV
ncbi:hypothetical protein OF83DRAFT_1178642 [Amylostereum chailletii]|nr:hypothetical protein OF83DRAFT_1178642 [Amylostereum chailletii]